MDKYDKKTLFSGLKANIQKPEDIAACVEDMKLKILNIKSYISSVENSKELQSATTVVEAFKFMEEVESKIEKMEQSNKKPSKNSMTTRKPSV